MLIKCAFNYSLAHFNESKMSKEQSVSKDKNRRKKEVCQNIERGGVGVEGFLSYAIVIFIDIMKQTLSLFLKRLKECLSVL